MTVFLILGLVGIALLAVALIFGDVLGDFDVPLLDSDVFSTAALAGFVGAFGFAGAAALEITGLAWVASIVGVVFGSAFAWFALRLSRALKRHEHSLSFDTNSLIGVDAKVITDIPAGGMGEIHLSAAGQIIKLSAASPIALAAGTQVWVSGVVSPTAVEVSPSHPELGT